MTFRYYNPSEKIGDKTMEEHLRFAVAYWHTVSLLTSMFGWGDFIFSVSLLQNQSMVPMSVGLYYFVGHYTSSWNILMAGSMIYDLIPLVVTIIAGKSLLSGLTVGALKE